MAKPSTIDGKLVILAVGDGAVPEVFTPICGTNSVQFNETSRTTDNFIRDCADPAASPEREVSVSGNQADITASGYENTDDAAQDLLEGAYQVTKNWRISYYEPDGTTLIYYRQGPGKLISKQHGANEEGKATIELGIASDGKFERVTP